MILKQHLLPDPAYSKAAMNIDHQHLSPDPDPQETAEWRDAFDALVLTQGPTRARQILDELSRRARVQRIGWQPELCTPYVNTINVNEQPVFPGDLAIEERIAALQNAQPGQV